MAQLVASGSTDLPVKKPFFWSFPPGPCTAGLPFWLSRPCWAPQKPISCGLRRSFRVGQTRAHTCSVHQRSRLYLSLRSSQLHSKDRDRKAICKNIKDWMHLKSLIRGWQMILSKVKGSVSYKCSWSGTLIQENYFLNKERSIKKKLSSVSSCFPMSTSSQG